MSEENRCGSPTPGCPRVIYYLPKEVFLTEIFSKATALRPSIPIQNRTSGYSNGYNHASMTSPPLSSNPSRDSLLSNSSSQWPNSPQNSMINQTSIYQQQMNTTEIPVYNTMPNDMKAQLNSHNQFTHQQQIQSSTNQAFNHSKTVSVPVWFRPAENNGPLESFSQLRELNRRAHQKKEQSCSPYDSNMPYQAYQQQPQQQPQQRQTPYTNNLAEEVKQLHQKQQWYVDNNFVTSEQVRHHQQQQQANIPNTLPPSANYSYIDRNNNNLALSSSGRNYYAMKPSMQMVSNELRQESIDSGLDFHCFSLSPHNSPQEVKETNAPTKTQQQQYQSQQQQMPLDWNQVATTSAPSISTMSLNNQQKQEQIVDNYNNLSINSPTGQFPNNNLGTEFLLNQMEYDGSMCDLGGELDFE